MSEELHVQTQHKEFPTTTLLANCTFNSKMNKEAFLDYKEQKSPVELELNILKEQHRRTLIELAKVNSQNKEFRNQILHFESIIQFKEREMYELKCQLDTKGSSSKRVQQRDLNLPRPSSKSPLDENTVSSKNPRSTLPNCDSEKLNLQNKSLKKELESLTEKVKRYEDEKSSKSEDYYLEMVQELTANLKLAEITKSNFRKEIEELREQLRDNGREEEKLKKENLDVKRKYDDLKSRYESLETTATSNKVDYSSESVANSESAISKKFSDNSKLLELGTKFQSEEEVSAWNVKECSVDYGVDDYRKILTQVMEIYKVKSLCDIIPSVQKTEKVLQMVPKLRKIIEEAANLTLPRLGHSKQKGNIEIFLPSIKKLCKEYDELDGFKSLRNKLVEVLEVEKDCSNVEIVKKVDKLFKFCYQTNEAKGTLRESRESIENSLLQNQFTKVFGVQPNLVVFKQILKQVKDFEHFLDILKYKLKLDPETKTENCMGHILKVVENSIKDKQVIEIVHLLQNTFNCSLEALVHTIEKIIFGNKKDKQYM